ncbi:MAG: rod-binding protein [Treponema sp.]|nr:rod-binding protein [Treponema sp.]
MTLGLVSNTYSSINNGNGALQAAKQNADNARFAELLERMKKQDEGRGTLSSDQISESGRLNGDFKSSFKGTYSLDSDKNADARGAAANQANSHVQQKKIDRTSELYEKSMELESYFVKQMLSSMRKTVIKANGNDFAQNMYEDMLYDEYATNMTKTAGFGLADQIYLSLV